MDNNQKFLKLIEQAVHDLYMNDKWTTLGTYKAVRCAAGSDADLIQFITSHTRSQLQKIKSIGPKRMKILDRVREILHDTEGAELASMKIPEYDENSTFYNNFRLLCEYAAPNVPDRRLGYGQIYANMLACAFGGAGSSSFNMTEMAKVTERELYRKLDRLVNECVDAFTMMQPTIAGWKQDEIQRKAQKYLSSHSTFETLVKILFCKDLYIDIRTPNEYNYKVYGAADEGFPACGWIADLSSTPYSADIYYAEDKYHAPKVLCRVSYDPDSKMITTAPLNMSFEADLASPRDRSNPIKGVDCYGWHPIDHLFECLDIAESDFNIHFDEPDHIRDAMRAIIYGFKWILDRK